MAGFILGLVSILAWIIAIVGLITSIVGLVLSIMGLKSTTRRGLATAGIILCAIFLIVSLANAVLGMYLFTHSYTLR